MKKNQTDLSVIALKYFDERNWAIHPLVPNEKKPVSTDWNKWSHELPTRVQIENWWKRNPNYNIGLVTGEASGVVVLDIDLHKNPNAAKELEALAYHGTGKRIVCPYVWTPGGGKHAYFAYPEGANIGCTSIGIEGIDTRGNGGNIVLPPSIHPNGKPYRWNAPLEDRDLPPLPDAIIAKLDKDRPAPKRVLVQMKLNPNDLLSTMMEQCAFCREFTPDTGAMHEELWYRWLTQMVCYDGGAELAYELSSGSEKFDDKTTQKKIAHAQEAYKKGFAPYCCAEIIDCEGWTSPSCLSCIAHPTRRNASPAGLPYILRSLEKEKERAGILPDDAEGIDLDEIAPTSVATDTSIPDEILDTMADKEGAQKKLVDYVTESVDEDAIDTAVAMPIPVLPETVWRGTFADYLQLMSPTTEASDSYHFASFLTTVGALLGRSVVVHYAGELFPNAYTVIVGRTGISRKTTAMKLATKTIQAVDATLITRRGLSTIEGLINLLRAPTEEELEESAKMQEPQTESAKQIIREQNAPMFEHEGRRLLITLDEFARLLKKTRQEASSTLIQGLTDAYDMPESLDNPTKENPMSARKPCLSIIGLTTKAWLEETLNYEDLLGGFVNRFIFFVGEPHSPMPLPPKPDEHRWNMLKILLHDIRFANHRISEQQHSPHEYDLLPEAKEFWTGYYNEWHKKQRECENETMASLYQRLPNHAMKAALIYAALEYREGEGEITLEQLKAGLDVANYAEKSYEYLFHSFGFSRRSRVEGMIEEKLRGGQKTKRELQRSISSAISLREFNEAIQDMMRADRISEISVHAKDKNGRNYSQKLLVLLK